MSWEARVRQWVDRRVLIEETIQALRVDPRCILVRANIQGASLTLYFAVVHPIEVDVPKLACRVRMYDGRILQGPRGIIFPGWVSRLRIQHVIRKRWGEEIDRG